MVFYLPSYVTPTFTVPDLAITARTPFVNVTFTVADLPITGRLVDAINLLGTVVLLIYSIYILLSFQCLFSCCHHNPAASLAAFLAFLTVVVQTALQTALTSVDSPDISVSV